MEIIRQSPQGSLGKFAIVEIDGPNIINKIKETEVKNKFELDTLIQEVAQYNNTRDEKSLERKLIKL